MKFSTFIGALRSKSFGLLKAVPDILLPKLCLTCDRLVSVQGGCCPQCWRELNFVSDPLCPVMGSPFSVDMGQAFLSAEAIADPPPFDRLRTVLLYDRMARRLVSSVKFADRTDVAPWIANWMVSAGSDLLLETDAIVPVPLHKSRLRSRRFNQSAELARKIGKQSGKSYRPEYLIRRKSTRQQVGLTQTQRQKNVSGAFLVPKELRAHVQSKRVTLVDDVYTTGATVKACARALRRAGADHIDVLVFAKVESFEI